MTEKQKDLCVYRVNQAEETVQSAKLCKENHFYKDAINRAYYAAFYAIKAVLAVEGVDFKRHKDVVAYFNQHYVATEKFEREMGKRIGRLKTMREDCDYDDFYVIERDEVLEQLRTAEIVIGAVRRYMESQGVM